MGVQANKGRSSNLLQKGARRPIPIPGKLNDELKDGTLSPFERSAKRLAPFQKYKYIYIQLRLRKRRNGMKTIKVIIEKADRNYSAYLGWH